MTTRGRLTGFLRAAIVLVLSALCLSCTMARALYFNVPDRHAPSYFAAREVAPSAHPLPFARAPEVDFPERRSKARRYDSFDALLAANHTTAMVVLHHDVIVYERYFDGVTEETRLPCFSMSKTFAAVAIGCAEQDGLIASADARLVAYVPALAKKPGYDRITIEHLLRMTSGIDYEEESVAGAMLYYTEDLRSQAHTYEMKWPAGTHYAYGSLSGQLLWEVLAPTLRGETVARYFEERVWGAMGAERAATWSLDSAEHGVEKFSSGLNATARDFARLGILFQHGGEIGGRRVVSQRWVDDSLAYDEVAGVVHTSDGAVRRGRYQWFWTLDGCCYFAKGYNGQYLFVDRARDVVIVRLGEGYGDVEWTALFERMIGSLPSVPKNKPPDGEPTRAPVPTPPSPAIPPVPPTRKPPVVKPMRPDPVAAVEPARVQVGFVR